MSQSKVISAYSSRNPVFKLLTHVIPGSKHFKHTGWRLCALVACVAVVAGVYQIAGGEAANLWHAQTFVSVLALTFILCTMKIGFRHTMVDFGSFLLGPPEKAGKHWNEFSAGIRGWAMQGAHLFALMTLFANLPTIRDVPTLATAVLPAVLGYVYAVFFGMVLPPRADNEKVQFSDAMMPGVFLICGYYLMRYFML